MSSMIAYGWRSSSHARQMTSIDGALSLPFWRTATDGLAHDTQCSHLQDQVAMSTRLWDKLTIIEIVVCTDVRGHGNYQRSALGSDRDTTRWKHRVHKSVKNTLGRNVTHFQRVRCRDSTIQDRSCEATSQVKSCRELMRP